MPAPEPLVPADLPAVLALYEHAFPASERVPSDVFAAELGRSRTVLVLRAGDRVVAFASLIELAPDARLLEYLAVRADARGGGHGGRLLTHLREQGGTLLLEVEDPAEPGLAPEEVTTRERRIAFYRRHGGAPAPFGIRYRPPSFDGSPTPQMALFVLGDAGRWTLPDLLHRLATGAQVSYASARP